MGKAITEYSATTLSKIFKLINRILAERISSTISKRINQERNIALSPRAQQRYP
ncbi:hypothetical protein HMPREF0454_04941 [Hafnia alvei ATCC 51873]|uniref:Uncharacterized protein n=1 Tax=Hafnia alvei ATCC 51873 TaxID=1002364 RepID=G9YE92_HAFAL|nr:hypothetical protein HMPREF0454_04941 [Hafnia alvei ATCC 51873]